MSHTIPRKKATFFWLTEDSSSPAQLICSQVRLPTNGFMRYELRTLPDDSEVDGLLFLDFFREEKLFLDFRQGELEFG